MIIPRNFRALRALPATSIRGPLVQTLAPSRFASVNRGKNDAGRDDLGGPGGQDPVPKASSSPRQDWTSYAAIGGVGVLVTTIFFYMLSSPQEAALMKEKAQAAQTQAKDNIKDAAKSVKG